ncbi:hypothetical protein HAX54_050516, partial [Datura stramonium]|nr:hypothetical protein [Datura stramonium]
MSTNLKRGEIEDEQVDLEKGENKEEQVELEKTREKAAARYSSQDKGKPNDSSKIEDDNKEDNVSLSSKLE